MKGPPIKTLSVKRTSGIIFTDFKNDPYIFTEYERVVEKHGVLKRKK